MISQKNTVSVVQTLERVKELIETKGGDVGRLRYIYEFLQKGRVLYRSDRIYLEKKINAEIVIDKPKEPSEEETVLRNIQNLLDLKIGYPERLQFMKNCLQKNKKLFQTDQKYLDEKLKLIPKQYQRRIPKISPQKFVLPPEISKLEARKPFKPVFSKITLPEFSEEYVNKLKTELVVAKETIQKLNSDLENARNSIQEQEVLIESQKQELLKLRIDHPLKIEEGELQSPELEELKERISQETKKVEEQKIISERIASQKEKLNELISYRKEYENKVNREKEILDEQIKTEAQKISEKDKLVEKLTQQQEELNRSRAEREVILRQIKQEQENVDKEIDRQQRELEKARAEYDELVKEFKEKQDLKSKSDKEESEDSESNN